ncbi:MAG: helix-turn-helix domain-containing protein [Mangrovibacterium sp.]
MNSRIRLILDYKGITATEFANAIGVQPSNVSHVLNGRNNPSQPFIEKILNYYPEINARWLLLGKGTMLDSEYQKEEDNVRIQNSLFDVPQESKPTELIEKSSIYKCKSSDTQQELLNNESKSPESIQTRHIIRIVTFYSDQTFEEYYPRN